jgi:hypothetical protein
MSTTLTFGFVDARKKKITQILDEETGSKSYRAHKYSLDTDCPLEPPKKYKFLGDLAATLAKRDEQVLTYFLDGSRHVYKVEDRGVSHRRPKLVYPTIAVIESAGSANLGGYSFAPHRLSASNAFKGRCGCAVCAGYNSRVPLYCLT